MPEDTNDTQTDNQDRNWKQTNDKIKRLERDLKGANQTITDLKEKVVQGVAKQAGFDTSKKYMEMVLEKFQSDHDVENYTEESFTEYASELGVEPAPTGETTTDDGETQGRENEQQMASLQSQADALQNVGTAPDEASQQADARAEAEQRGDWQSVISMDLSAFEDTQQEAPTT